MYLGCWRLWWENGCDFFYIFLQELHDFLFWRGRCPMWRSLEQGEDYFVIVYCSYCYCSCYCYNCHIFFVIEVTVTYYDDLWSLTWRYKNCSQLISWHHHRRRLRHTSPLCCRPRGFLYFNLPIFSQCRPNFHSQLFPGVPGGLGSQRWSPAAWRSDHWDQRSGYDLRNPCTGFFVYADADAVADGHQSIEINCANQA